MTDSIAFSALLCSRLCHDLVNPVGAFSNGLEILADEDDPDIRRQVVELLAQSAGQTAQRLQFFRLAFGAGSGFGGTIPAAALRDAATAYFAGGKVQLAWEAEILEVTREAGKILLNLILIASEALLRGGVLAVGSARSGGQLELTVTATGDRLLFKPVMATALKGEAEIDALDPKTAPAHLAAAMARLVGGSITAAYEQDRLLRLAVRLV